MDCVGNFMDEGKIKADRQKVLWITFVDRVDNFAAEEFYREKNAVSLCMLYNRFANKTVEGNETW